MKELPWTFRILACVSIVWGLVAIGPVGWGVLIILIVSTWVETVNKYKKQKLEEEEAQRVLRVWMPNIQGPDLKDDVHAN